MDSDIQSDTYKYQPLANQSDNFRVIELFPASPDGTIRCNIVAEAISQSPEYEALSYEWGSPEETTWIQVNSFPFQIRYNLYLALERLCPTAPGEKRKIFVDALCINQADVEERNSQVQLMGQIYENAQQVLAWLGPAADDSDIAFDIFDGVLNTLPSSRLSYMADGRREVEFKSLLRRLSGGDSKIRYSMLRALDNILRRSYWNRVWIVQELRLARSIRVFCGSRSIPWDGINVLADHSFRLRLRMGVYSDLRHVTDPMRWGPPHRPTKPASLLDLISQYSAWECTVPHDHVYGFLGLASDCKNGASMIVDYSCSLENLFFNTLRFCKPADLLWLARILLRTVYIPNLPNAGWMKPWVSRPEKLQMLYIGKIGVRSSSKHVSFFDPTCPLLRFDILPEQSLLDYEEPMFEFARLVIAKYHCVTDVDVQENDRILWICGSDHALIFRKGLGLQRSAGTDAADSTDILIGRAVLLCLEDSLLTKLKFRKSKSEVWTRFTRMPLLPTKSPWIFDYGGFSGKDVTNMKYLFFSDLNS